jgi:hypothetical protein
VQCLLEESAVCAVHTHTHTDVGTAFYLFFSCLKFIQQNHSVFLGVEDAKSKLRAEMPRGEGPWWMHCVHPFVWKKKNLSLTLKSSCLLTPTRSLNSRQGQSVVKIYTWPSVFSGSLSNESMNSVWKIFENILPLPNMYRLFPCHYSKQCSTRTTYTALTCMRFSKSTRGGLKYAICRRDWIPHRFWYLSQVLELTSLGCRGMQVSSDIQSVI